MTDKPDDKPTPRCNRCRGNPHIGACHDKPPDRAEWEVLLLELIEIADDDDACDIEVVEAEKQLRVAVQRAIDEREITTWKLAADLIHRCDNENDLQHSGWDIHGSDAISEYQHDARIGLLKRAAAAEARARRNDV